MKNLMTFLFIVSSTSSFAAGIFGKSSIEKKLEDLLDDRERIESFVMEFDKNSSRSGCRFFYNGFNERRAKAIEEARALKKKPKDLHLLEEVEELNVADCETLAKEYAYDP